MKKEVLELKEVSFAFNAKMGAILSEAIIFMKQQSNKATNKNNITKQTNSGLGKRTKDRMQSIVYPHTAK